MAVLLERGGLLAELTALQQRAAGGQGALVFVGGEAGVGKTSLVSAFARTAGTTVRRGTCDNLTTAAALGPLVEAVPELADLVEAEVSPGRQVLFRRLHKVLAAEPTVLVLEDVHWADESTLEMLRALGRRLEGLPALVLVTYRADEVGHTHPLSLVMGSLATAPGVSRLDVAPLSIDAVRCLVEAAGSAVDADELYESTGGNAFYVSEVLAGGSVEMPPTVRDAVLERASRLSPEGRRVLAAAAVLGQRADLQLLAVVSGQRAAAVDECVARGMLVRDGDGWVFRHELARLAVEQTLSPVERASAHGAALRTLVSLRVRDDRRLAHHAAGSGDNAAVLTHAPRAAARAARLGAHGEAVELYRMALRAHDPSPDSRRAMLEALSYECYLTDELVEALTARQQALELAELAGDVEGVGVSQRWMSRLAWFLGRNADAERYAERAVATLEPLGDGHALGMAYSNAAQLRMNAGDAAEAVAWGERAVAVARRIGDREVEAHALNNIGTAMQQDGDSVEGRVYLGRSLDLSLADDLHEHAVRAYTNLGSNAVLNRRHVDGERDLRAGIAYGAERDLDAWTLYMGGWLARTLAEQGRMDEAAECAADVLRHPNLSPVIRIVAGVARAQIDLRRGGDADAALDEALRFAMITGEAQRLAPVVVARAEAAWLAGRTEAIPREIDRAWSVAAAHPSPWDLGELSWWAWVGGERRRSPVPVAEPFALMLAGSWQQAAQVLERLHCPVWSALALGFCADLDDARRAVEILDAVGAQAVREALLRSRQAAGLAVPRGPRATSRENPSQLTTRELEVLHLLADGLSNAEMAGALFLSQKTVGHHVSSVLRKLGEPSRARAVAAAIRDGIVTPT